VLLKAKHTGVSVCSFSYRATACQYKRTQK